MSARLAAATGVWRDRQVRDLGDRAYLAYTLVLAALIVGAPIGRTVWLRITTETSSSALTSSAAGTIAGTVVLGIWAAALLIGRSRGPAVAPPFLVHALTGSDLRRRTVFRSRVLTAVSVAVVIGGGIAVFIGLALGSLGLVSAPAVLDFALRGALVGVVAVVCWLIGESFPRVAGALAVVLLLLAVAAQVVSAEPFGRWAWVSSAGPVVAADVVLLVLAVAGLVAVPWLLDRIDDATLTAQAANWDVAIAHAVSLDFTSVAESYQALPTVGRRIEGVRRSARLWVVFVVRDLVGAVRTPARLATGVVTVAGAGAFLVLAAVAPAGGFLLGALAAVLLYTGVGAFSRGLHHAAQVTTDLPLYGVGDGRLLLVHSIVPTGATLLLTGGTAIVLGAVVAPASVPVLVWGGIALPIVVVAAHLSNALRGPAPLFLMTPAPSAVGDPMPVIRVLWAMDAPVLAVLAGVAVSAGAAGIGGFVAVAVVLGLFLLVRWSRRTEH
ncbi:hypothetical protein [Curtobacterium sp. Curtsp57]|uniref:hypothetical protein n=1 Tax=Curtobacterium sp. Curtsp57 TaxID=3243047 RepID=UPI0039B38A94